MTIRDIVESKQGRSPQPVGGVCTSGAGSLVASDHGAESVWREIR